MRIVRSRVARDGWILCVRARVSVLAVALLAATLSGGLLAQDARDGSRISLGHALERALLQSELHSVGALRKYDEFLPAGPDKARALECFRSRNLAYVKDFYAQIWVDALPEPDLREGAALASVPVIDKVLPLIVANRAVYRAEAQRQKRRFDVYYLVAVAEYVTDPAEKQALARFAGWVEANAPKINARLIARMPVLVMETADLMQQCSPRN